MAEAFSGSGVLAVLVCALYLTDAGTDFGDRDYRLVGDAFWGIIEMLSSGFAFGLIDLELGVVLTVRATAGCRECCCRRGGCVAAGVAADHPAPVAVA
ncbi:hypothetical protein ACWEO2_16930 [Nocardia sp. NPDC004278]